MYVSVWTAWTVADVSAADTFASVLMLHAMSYGLHSLKGGFGGIFFKVWGVLQGVLEF